LVSTHSEAASLTSPRRMLPRIAPISVSRSPDGLEGFAGRCWCWRRTTRRARARHASRPVARSRRRVRPRLSRTAHASTTRRIRRARLSEWRRCASAMATLRELPLASSKQISISALTLAQLARRQVDIARSLALAPAPRRVGRGAD
jgi:hypothetical protein